MTQISFSDVSKSYKKKYSSNNIFKDFFKSNLKKQFALNKVSFQIKKGEKVALLGPNGSGKSTTMKLLSGIITPDDGNILINNHLPQRRQGDFLKTIGLLSGQKSHLWWDLPPIDSFKLIKEIYEIDDTSYRERLEFIVKNLGAHDLIYKQTRKLSLGERMKMELTLVLLHMPQLLLLDEPTIGLDYKSQYAIVDILNRFHAEFNITIILTSHYIKDIENLCERVIILDKGNKIFDDSLVSLKNQHAYYYNVKIITDTIDFNLIKNHAFLLESVSNTHILKVEKNKLKNILSFLTEQNITDFIVEDASVEDALDSLFRKESV